MWLGQIKIKMMCDTCCYGEMIYTGVRSPFNNKMFLHQCSRCERIEEYKKQYPYVEDRKENADE